MYKDYKIIALCVSKIHTDTIFTFTQKLNSELTKSNYRLLVFNTTTDLLEKSLNTVGEVTVYDLIPYDIVDAVIIYDEYMCEKDCVNNIILNCKQRDIPIVVIENDYEGCYTLTYEQDAGFEQVIRHVVEDHKITDLLFISGYDNVTFCINRVERFKKVLADNNIPFRDDMVLYGGLWYLPTEEATMEIINSGHIPEAIICINDFTAITVCETLEKHGIRVPEDVIVTGFDGMDEAKYFNPSITTAKCDVDEAITLLARLFDDITDKQTDKGKLPKKIGAPFTLRKGLSCGCGQNYVFENAGKLLKDTDERLKGYIEIEQKLHDITERLVMSNSFELFLETLNQLEMFDVSIMVNKDFMSSTENPLLPQRSCSFDDDMVVIFTEGQAGIEKLTTIKKHELTPKFDTLIENKRPFVFSTICFLGNPMGYICFNYDTLINSFCLIPQYIIALDRILGDYKNIRYLNHIAISMEELSCRDYMTNLLNRNGFYRHLDDFLMLTAESADIIVATIDMDGLKKINDTYGHDLGDYAITTIARAIDEIDVHHKIAARFGGDEFVLCAVMNEEENTDDLVNLIRTNLDILQDNEKPFRVNISIGCSTCKKKDFDIDKFLKESDDKMYAEKKSKPNRR